MAAARRPPLSEPAKVQFFRDPWRITLAYHRSYSHACCLRTRNSNGHVVRRALDGDSRPRDEQLKGEIFSTQAQAWRP